VTILSKDIRLIELEQRKIDLLRTVERTTNVTAAAELRSEIADINSQMSTIKTEQQEQPAAPQETRTTPQGQLNVLATYGVGQQTQQENQRAAGTIRELEQRAAEFRSGRSVTFDLNEADLRAVTVAGGEIVVPTHTSNGLKPGLNEVSSIVDQVKSFPLPGGNSYKSGFVVSAGEGDYTAESADYFESDPVFDYVSITKAKITTYFEISEEVQKIGGEYYLTTARDLARTAIRKKMAQQIMIGTGGDERLMGIFNAPANVIPADSDVTIDIIDGLTLDKIIFSHGGDESLEGGAYLFLNKQTLADFAACRTANGDPQYKIKLDATGNTGSISSRDSFEVPFTINSAVKSFTTAVAGDYFLAYGKPMAYEMPIFSGLEIQESRDFKFKSGQICIKAAVWAGGNTASYKGFTRVKKG
jgi:HK97 family phage major capsid protein